LSSEADLKKIIFAALLFCTPLTFLFSQTDGAAPDVPDAAITNESELKFDEPLPAPGSDDDAVRESERAYAFDSGGNFQGGVSIWSVLRIFITLLLVALAIYGVLYFFKNYQKNKNKAVNNDKYFKILAAAPLNAKTAAAVISVGKKAWLVGLADSSVSLISEINDQETVDMMLLDYSENAALNPEGALPDFFAVLQRFIPASGKKPPANIIKTADNLRKNRDKLHNL
jgi:flagellar biogenesis protein FliO